MSDLPMLSQLDQTLIAFQEACPKPTSDQVADWTARFPTFAAEIRSHAEAMLQSVPFDEVKPATLTPEELQRSSDRAMSLMTAASARLFGRTRGREM